MASDATRARATTCALLAAALTTAQFAAPAAGQDLGTVSFPVSCGPEVQPRFDRAVALLHHMTYPEARAAFRAIAADAPGCAMAHWGIAMTLFQPLWPTRPGPAELALGREEVRKALAIGAPTSRERRFIDAAGAFFLPESADYWARIAAWEAASAALFDSIPDDVEAASFHALAHLATAPPGGGTGHQDAAAAILARVLAVQPSHPGAVHYTIHANDVAGRERDAPDVVERYLGIAPENPHALHMPTHIWVRLGDWPRVIEWNERAAAAALLHPAGDRGQWVWDEFPHALEYLVHAHLQRGDDAAARAAMERLLATTGLEPSFKTAFHLSSVPARYTLERRAWAEAAALPVRTPAALPWDRFPWPEGVTWFAKGLGAAHTGDAAAARAAVARLVALRDGARASGEELFARSIEVLRLEVSAALAERAGDGDRAVALMKEAHALERATPKHAVTPAPTLLAGELLGDLLLRLGRPADALAAYLAALADAPDSFNAVAGAARAAAEAGDTAAATSYRRQLAAQAAPGSTRAALRDALQRRR